MIFNRFSLSILIRVSSLVLCLIGLSLALSHHGFYAITLLLTLISLIIVTELYYFVARTNIELRRFLEAASSEDFTQSFQTLSKGAAFKELNETFVEIMARFQLSKQAYETKLKRMVSLLEHVPVPLLSVFPDGRIRLHNNAARRFFSEIKVSGVEDLKLLGNELFDAIQDIRPGNTELVNYEYDGVKRQLTMQMTEVITDSIEESVISLQDIQSELDFAQLSAWQDLVRVLTHEMMNSITPVASLATTASILVDDVQQKIVANQKNTLEITDELNDVRRATDTVAKRSEGLMQFVKNYKSMTEMPVPKKQRFSISELFDRVYKLIESQLLKNKISLIQTITPETLELEADADLVEQLLLNLLQNAQQAISGQNANQEAKIELTARLNKRGFVLIELGDNGPGVAEEVADEVFMPFYTTKAKGSGVGLALTRQIMIAHGGNVSLSKSKWGGAKFSLIF